VPDDVDERCRHGMSAMAISGMVVAPRQPSPARVLASACTAVRDAMIDVQGAQAGLSRLDTASCHYRSDAVLCAVEL